MTDINYNRPPVGRTEANKFSTKNSALHAPRALVEIAGYQFTPLSVSITQNSHGVLDTGSADLVISSNPDLSELFQSTKLDGSVMAKIYIGFPPEASTTRLTPEQLHLAFYGIVDTYKPNFKSDVCSISFRSLGALLELTRQTNLSRLETTVAFVKAAAASVGLQTNIVLAKGQASATLANVAGRDLQVGLQNQRLWDTIINCAEYDDVDVWVSGNTLNYVSTTQITRKKVYLGFGNDFVDFDGSHSPQFNKHIKVEVRTWNPKQRWSSTTRYTYSADGTPPTVTQSTRFATIENIFGTNGILTQTTSTNATTGTTSTATSASGSSGGAFNSGYTTLPRDSSSDKIIIRKPYLTQAQANTLALSTLRRITRNLYTATFTVVPTPQNYDLLKIDSAYALSGVPYDKWNASAQFPFFYPRRMTTTFSLQQGLTIQIEAENHIPFNEGI